MARLQSQAQAGPSIESQGKVSLWLRTGVFGHRDIDPDHPGLTQAIDEALAAICCMHSHIQVHVESTPVGLAVVSSLAEGADRILARAVLAREGTRLEVVLPFDREDYYDDFSSPESREEFDELINKATVDVIEPAESRKHAYEAAGHAMVDRSDIVVAVWDGKPARGRGGTADIYAYAMKCKKPIFWIQVNSDAAELAEQPFDLRAANVLLPHESLKNFDRYNGEMLPASIFTTTPPLIRLSAIDNDTIVSTAELLEQYVRRYFTRADTLAGRFQRRWFWVTRLLYTLAPLAVAIVAVQILFEPSHERYAWFEFGILVCVTVLVLVARLTHWHDRWISGRYLAEQIRSLVFLGLAGVDLPDVARSSAGNHADPTDMSGWTERAAAEIWWSRPRYEVADDTDGLRKVLDREWIYKQLKYHMDASEKYAKRSRWFTIVAVALFAVSAIAALLHSLGAGPVITPPDTLWGYLSIVIPAIGAATSGYAAQRDYTRHSERSRQVTGNLKEARSQLHEAENFSDIQKVVLSTRRLMHSEATQWYSVVHSQDIEPP
jgi:SMODS and SLOG-associating 2TM effector domain 1